MNCYGDWNPFLIFQWVFCLDVISTAFLWSFVNVIYKSLHNCSLQSRLQGPVFLLSACRPCSVFNKDVAECVCFVFFFHLCFSNCDPSCRITNQIVHPINWWMCDMWNTGDHTPSLKTWAHFPIELSPSHHGFWLDQKSGLIPQRTSYRNSQCQHPPHAHTFLALWTTSAVSIDQILICVQSPCRSSKADPKGSLLLT